MTSKREEIDGRPVDFGVTTAELQSLMENRGHDGYQMIQNQYGGITELCKKLYTSPNEGQSPFFSPFIDMILVMNEKLENVLIQCEPY